MPKLEPLRQYDPYQPRRLEPTAEDLAAKERASAKSFIARMREKSRHKLAGRVKQR